MHCVAFGVHDPVHAPETHAWFVQGAAAPHCPLAPHVCTPSPEHCVAPGEHTPVHPPETHAWLVQLDAVPHAPPALHVWTPLPEHCVVPGVHATHEPFTHTGVPPPHADAPPHWPFEPHVSTLVPSPASAPPEHCVAPGVHTPVHAPALHTY